VIACLAFASAANYEGQFLQFVRNYQKVYADDSETLDRFEIFKTNLDQINAHNAAGRSWTMAVNEWADQTWEEFSEGRLGYVHVERERSFEEVDLSGQFTTPSSVDWTAEGVVTSVKNQGQCGSCWSFSTTGAIEGAYAIKTGQLNSLSEQQLVDCDKTDGGCQGGLMDNAFQFVVNNGGLCSESDYPYQAKRGTCSTSCTAVSTISSYKDVSRDNVDAMLTAVALQPVSIAIEADQKAFQFYDGGILDYNCGTSLDHGVLLTGYGSEDGEDYWIVKNSWGASWGDNGYIRLARGKQQPYGLCGLLMAASYPVA
jgi:C1A family cysteine protease